MFKINIWPSWHWHLAVSLQSLESLPALVMKWNFSCKHWNQHFRSVNATKCFESSWSSRAAWTSDSIRPWISPAEKIIWSCVSVIMFSHNIPQHVPLINNTPAFSIFLKSCSDCPFDDNDRLLPAQDFDLGFPTHGTHCVPPIGLEPSERLARLIAWMAIDRATPADRPAQACNAVWNLQIIYNYISKVKLHIQAQHKNMQWPRQQALIDFLIVFGGKKPYRWAHM